MGKIGNLKAKVGTYMKDGQEKGRYVDVGVLMQSDDGSYYALINPTFNPAGVPMQGGKDMVMVSVFQDQQQNNNGGQGYQQQPNQPQQQNGYNQQSQQQPPQYGQSQQQVYPQQSGYNGQ